jgi:hypothetical protein
MIHLILDYAAITTKEVDYIITTNASCEEE